MYHHIIQCIFSQISREHGVPFLETSAKANINVEKAFMDLAQAILNKVRSITIQIQCSLLGLFLSKTYEGRGKALF